MTRQLRPRKQTNYATLATGDQDDEVQQAGPRAGPSKKRQKKTVDDSEGEGEDSGSDFAPTDGPGAVEDEKDGEQSEEDMLVDEEEAERSRSGPSRRRKGSNSKAKATSTPSAKPTPVKKNQKLRIDTQNVQTSSKGKAKAKPAEEQSASTTPRVPKRQMYVLPVPSVNHRHRAMPIYARKGPTERLTTRPSLFSSPSVALTNASSSNPKLSSRVNKAWAYNVGPGPLWDLCEDRGWYKEASQATAEGQQAGYDSKRRPIVYPGLVVPNGWRIMTREEATSYLPTTMAFPTEGPEPSPPVSCLFGPFRSQTKRSVAMFDSFSMSQYSPENHAQVFNAGGPVWGLDWCPIHAGTRPARSHRQYLSVAPFPSKGHSPDVGKRAQRPAPACIQIWSLSDKGDGTPQMHCEMVLGVNTGPAYELKWCPLPSHSALDDTRRPRKLGLLGGTFEDGSFSLFVVPDPDDLRSDDMGPSEPIFVELPQPVIRIELPDGLCWTCDWANSEVIAIGTTNGLILVYDLGPVLKSYIDPNMPPIVDLYPTHHLFIHQSAIRALAWIKAPSSSPTGDALESENPTVVASGGYDGMECLTDIREGRGSIINRTRDAINAMSFSPFAGGPITLDHENSVKAYSASPSMLGRGHSLLEPQGPVWDIHASEYHPQLAVCAADGSCSTTNTLRATRRGGSVPFFVYKIFQMDYNRNTKEYRMLDQFLPQEFVDRPTATRAAKGKNKAQDGQDGRVHYGPSGAWPTEVGVHRVAWNNGNGLASCALLASGTASGLCRVDYVWGRWARDKIPYTSVEDIRMENFTGGEDSDDDDEDVDVDGDADGDVDMDVDMTDT